MLILGVNEGAHASVTICRDGVMEFALQEERISKQKENTGFPHKALEFSLRYLGLSAGNFDVVALSHLDSPTLSRRALLDDYEVDSRGMAETLLTGRWNLISTKMARNLRRAGWMRAKHGPSLDIAASLARHGLQHVPTRRFDHHSNLAAAAYWGMRQDQASPHLVLTLDNGGDGACAEVHVAEEGHIRLVASTSMGHSLGQIYSHLTWLLGLDPYEHEYKLMELAAYANPDHYKDTLDILKSYIGLHPHDPLYFKRKIPENTAMAVPRLARDLRRRRFDVLAGAVQRLAEDLMVAWVKACVAKTGVRKVVASGSMFTNVKANMRIAALEDLEYFDVFPSCSDECLAFGAAWQATVARKPQLEPTISFSTSNLGPDAGFDLEQAMALNKDRLCFEKLDDPAAKIVELLSAGCVVARCAGRMEFGARSLGNRSLLADPADPRVIERINRAIKQRDFWIPFAPSASIEAARDYIVVSPCLPNPRISPFMMHCFKTTDRRFDFIAGVHPYDGTTRMQVVSSDTNPDFHAILTRFGEKTGRSALLNTSFNLHNSPIVTGAADAMEAMLRSDIRYLVINDILVTRPETN